MGYSKDGAVLGRRKTMLSDMLLAEPGGSGDCVVTFGTSLSDTL